MTNIARGFAVLCATSSLILTISGCSTPSQTPSGSQVAHDLLVVAQASQTKMNAIGITESFYVNSQNAAKPFNGKGDLQGDSVYDPSIKNSVSRFPQNPSYRQIGAGEGPGTQAVAVALSIATGYKSTDPKPTESNGVFTFPQPAEYNEVQIVTVKNGLIFSVLIEDSLVDPSFTNLYEVDAYGINNPLANKILHTKS
ncbi:MAG: hypothetical protein ACKOWI_07210 [Rhodoluna sp.]